MTKWQKFVKLVQCLPARIQVVLTSAVMWINTATAFIIIAADEFTKLLAPEQAERVTLIVVRVLAFLAAMVSTIRRVTPVRKQDRGLL